MLTGKFKSCQIINQTAAASLTKVHGQQEQNPQANVLTSTESSVWLNESDEPQRPQVVSSVFVSAQAAVQHVQEVWRAASQYKSWYQLQPSRVELSRVKSCLLHLICV